MKKYKKEIQEIKSILDIQEDIKFIKKDLSYINNKNINSMVDNDSILIDKEFYEKNKYTNSNFILKEIINSLVVYKIERDEIFNISSIEYYLKLSEDLYFTISKELESM